jgi:hypothetical protein
MLARWKNFDAARGGTSGCTSLVGWRRKMDDRERNIRIDYHLVQAERWISHKDDTGLYHAVQEILEAIKLLAKSQ